METGEGAAEDGSRGQGPGPEEEGSEGEGSEDLAEASSRSEEVAGLEEVAESEVIEANSMRLAEDAGMDACFAAATRREPRPNTHPNPHPTPQPN